MKKNNKITGLFRKVIVILLAVVLAAGVPSPTDVHARIPKIKGNQCLSFLYVKVKDPMGYLFQIEGFYIQMFFYTGIY